MTNWVKKLSECVVLGAVSLSAWTSQAAEQPPRSEQMKSGGGDWARGVSPHQQQMAKELFEKGNDSLDESNFAEAIQHYRQALQYWDHPAIHYNLGLALMSSDKADEAYRHLSDAVRYGVGPLDESKYTYALQTKGLIEKKMTWLDVSCDEPGASVMLDGKTLFTAPSRFKGLVDPGVHSLVAVKQDKLFIDNTQALPMTAGGRVTLNLKMYNPAEVTRTQTRWPTWMPWTLMGSSLAVAAGGGLMQWQAYKDYGSLEKSVSFCKTACTPDSELLALRHRGDTLQRASVGAYALGGAGLVTGAVLLFLNRPTTHLIHPESGAPVSISPLLGPTSGVQATIHY